ncbi:hypothetical protein EDB89DRAFT_2073455 [Lactarius sanguifluus]|nr:hypothetical protein EDB89DRAFT_2073455 [Lactarius sanguifluus]
MIVLEVKPYCGHSKDIASHLVVALPRLAASDGIATCLVLVSPIHARSRPRPFAFAPALAIANAPDSASLLFTSVAPAGIGILSLRSDTDSALPTQSQARSPPSWYRLPQCCHPHHLWLTQLTALLVCALLTGHLSEEERDVVFFYPCLIIFPCYSKPHHCPSSAVLNAAATIIQSHPNWLSFLCSWSHTSPRFINPSTWMLGSPADLRSPVDQAADVRTSHLALASTLRYFYPISYIARISW